jgi:hypothetical protein
MTEPEPNDPRTPEPESPDFHPADAQNGWCYRVGANPNPYAATKEKCLQDGGAWEPIEVQE